MTGPTGPDSGLVITHLGVCTSRGLDFSVLVQAQPMTGCIRMIEKSSSGTGRESAMLRLSENNLNGFNLASNFLITL